MPPEETIDVFDEDYYENIKSHPFLAPCDFCFKETK